MKSSNSREKDNNSKNKGRTSKQASPFRPLTAPVKQSYLTVTSKSTDRTNTPHVSFTRPKTTQEIYRDNLSPPSRPQSSLSDSSLSSTSRSNLSRSKNPKDDRGPKGSSRGRRKSLKTKVQVAWDDDLSSLDTKTHKTSTYDKVMSLLPKPNIYDRPKRTTFKPTALVPGSVCTMVTLDESDENIGKSEELDDMKSDTKIPLSPCFADLLSSDGSCSSEYDTDLEEDFPVKSKEFDPSGKALYVKMCNDKDLVPVSYLTKRLKEKEIVMRHHGLGTQGTLPIAKSLKKNTYTEKLDLTDNYIEGPGAVALATMLQDNCFITDINLSMNFIHSEGGAAFAQMIHKNQSLRKLVLQSNHLTDKDAKVFAEALKENRTLEYLDLSHNEIGELGGIYLGSALAVNYGLKHFDVSWNCIRFKGAVGIAQALKSNDCLKHFNISWNGLSLLGCVALGRFLKKNEALTELDISNNRIGLLGTQKLAAGIAGHPNLKVLKIGKNPMGDVGVECLLNIVKTHNTITYLSLEDITVSPRIFDEIKGLEAERGITIITGGIGGYKRPKELPPGMRVLLNFISDNRLRLVDWFNQFDKDHSGGISYEEFRNGLKETGLVMTTRQLDRLIEYLDLNDDGEIEYSELLRGREITVHELRIEKKIEERNKRIQDERMILPKLEGYDYDLM